MSAVFIWTQNNDGRVANAAGVTVALRIKPTLSFAYDAIYFEATNSFKMVNGARVGLTAAEITELQNFAEQHVNTEAGLVNAVDNNGKWLGRLTAANAPHVTPVAPPTGDYWRWDFTLQQWIYIQAVDAQGKWLGNVQVGTYAAEVPSAPPYSYFVWDFTNKVWKDGRTLADLKTQFSDAIDVAADNVALYFVSAGQTQSARYQLKYENALAYKNAGYPNSATPSTIDPKAYPYIYYETTQRIAAGETTVTGQSVADLIVGLQQQWAVIGAKIEGIRVSGKFSLSNAADIQTATNVSNTTINNLNALRSLG